MRVFVVIRRRNFGEDLVDSGSGWVGTPPTPSLSVTLLVSSGYGVAGAVGISFQGAYSQIFWNQLLTGFSAGASENPTMHLGQ